MPTFGWGVLGVVLRRAGLLADRLISQVSRLAFNVGLPLMLFAGAAQFDYSALGSARYLLAGILATLFSAVTVTIGFFLLSIFSLAGTLA